MARGGEDPIGSMGTDTPIAVLSDRSRLLYDYFKQNFAQVTNPPIDPIREELVMSLLSMIGPRPNLLGRDAGTHKRLEVSQPILTNEGLAKVRSVEVALDGAFRTATIDITWDARTGADGLADGAERDVLGCDRGRTGRCQHPDPVGPARAPIAFPCPRCSRRRQCITSLVRQGLRMQTGLVIETGEAREVHHFCALAGYGAEGINPYLAFETLETCARSGSPNSTRIRSARITSKPSARGS